LTAQAKNAAAEAPPAPSQLAAASPPRTLESAQLPELLKQIVKTAAANGSTRVMALCALVGTATAVYAIYMTPEVRANRAFPKLVLAPSISAELVVHRPAIEKAIRDFADAGPARASFLVIVGQMGSGKSTAAQVALMDRCGVIAINLGGSNKDPVRFQIAAKLGLSSDPAPDLAKLGVLLKKLAKEKLGGRLPVLVVELDRLSTLDLTNNALLDVKFLGPDNKVLKCIVILSDANAAFHLKEGGRQEYLWVGGMTLAETTAFFNKRGQLPTEEGTAAHALAPEDAAANKALIARLHDAGVATPFALDKCAGVLPPADANASARDPAVVAAVEAVILDAQKAASSSVKDLAAANPAMPYRAVYRALLAACDAEDARRAGLSEDARAKLPPVTETAGTEREDVAGMPTAAKIAPQFKEHHALHFHPDTKTFHFASAAHRHAAKKWLEATSWWRFLGY
jgi:hypothetical protein